MKHLIGFKGHLRETFYLKKPLSDILGIFYATPLSVRET